MVLRAINIAQGRYWKRIEQQRFAILQGDRTALATEQPRLDVASVQLPLTIKLRYTKEFVLLLTGATLLLAFFFAGTLTLSGPWFFPSNALLFFLVIFFIVVAFFIVIIMIVVRFNPGHQEIEVKEKRITARYVGKVATVEWEEARLFAMYNTFGTQKNGAAITHELSSARDIVRWTWVRHKTFFVSQEPTVPLDEHNRQMQELLALVQAKTGLPLYDLRH
ncbi:MAG: hypothetical protein M3Y39_20825 [Chloroflexota bacterium]|nr:hypothetical protein [Chloroflexota bacterium]